MHTSMVLLEGRLDEAERQAEQTYTEGQRAQSWDAGAAHLLALGALRREQGRLAELEDDLIEAGSLYPGYRLFRCVLALACLERDGRATARACHGLSGQRDQLARWAAGGQPLTPTQTTCPSRGQTSSQSHPRWLLLPAATAHRRPVSHPAAPASRHPDTAPCPRPQYGALGALGASGSNGGMARGVVDAHLMLPLSCSSMAFTTTATTSWSTR